ncbi:hypothetical protein [Dechloromonas sp. A34]|nr:hypothetical protein [Dechloromonas sp. A34]
MTAVKTVITGRRLAILRNHHWLALFCQEQQDFGDTGHSRPDI